jgi:glutaminase
VLLAEHGRAVQVLELQGDLRFSTLEPVLREVAVADAGREALLLDFKRVSHADEAATRLLARLIEACGTRGEQVVLTRVKRGELLAALGTEVDPKHARAFSFQVQLDLGLEACERMLLSRYGGAHAVAALATLADHGLCLGATAEELAALQAAVERRSVGAGQTLMRRGDAADALLLLVRGEVSVVVPLPQGGHKRLATLSAGMALGEAALLVGGRRSADVIADTEIEALALTPAAFAQLQRDHPALAIRLLHNLLATAAEAVDRLTAEVAALET